MKRNATNASHQQTNKQRKRPHTVSLLLFKNLRSARKTIFFFFFFFCFLLWVGFFGSAENSVLTYHAHTSWRQALPQYARPVVAYFDSGLEHHHNRGGQPLPTLLHSVRVRFSAAGIWHSRYHIIDNTAPAHTTTNGCFANFFLLLFSGPIIHTLCRLPLPAALLYSIELDRAPAPRT